MDINWNTIPMTIVAGTCPGARFFIHNSGMRMERM